MMVFGYKTCKLITESPQRRRCGSVSPRKGSPTGRLPHVTSSISQLVSTLDYEAWESPDVLDLIPEREWRLLAVLARKRQEDIERQMLADQFHKMWHKEQEVRKVMAAETSHEYRQYLNRKRDKERAWHELQHLERVAEQQMRSQQILECIKHKERRSEDLLAWSNSKKTMDLIEKSVEDEARCLLAADRRSRRFAAQELRRRLELMDAERKVDEARTRRNAMLRDASQRVAISNALSSWESSLLLQEVTAMEAGRRAQHAARAALTAARGERLARARDARQRRARRVAAIAAHLREVLREGRL